MPLYAYKGIDAQGCWKKTTQLAPHLPALLTELKQQHFILIHASFVSSKVHFWQKPHFQEVLTFFMHLEGQTQCGWSLPEALRSFLSITPSLPLQAAVARIIERLEAGESLGDAFAPESSLFGSLSIGL
ncbi:MAG: hypothetical protein LBD66_01495, partial [Holosporales bacterium]|nr:hypothetical protein [Holosporales bacterium]